MTGERIALIGAGKLGTTLARLLVSAGYDVSVATASGPGSTGLILGILAPGAKAETLEDALAGADLAILALPLSQVPTLRADLFDGLLVIDATNHWEPTDGSFDDLTSGTRSTAYVQSILPGAMVVKALSHLGYHELDRLPAPTGAQGRTAMAFAGESANEVAVAELIDRLGFDPVFLGPIETSAIIEPGGALFGVAESADQLRTLSVLSRDSVASAPA